MKKKNKNKKSPVVEQEQTKTLSKKEIQKSLDKIKNKRKKLDAATHDSSRKKILDELFQEVSSLEKVLAPLPENVFQSSMTKDEKIEKMIESGLKEYNTSVQQMEDILKKEEETFENNTLSEEELEALQNDFMNQKEEVNQASIKAKRKIADHKKVLSSLKKQEQKEQELVHEAAIKKEEVKKDVKTIIEPIHEATIKRVEFPPIEEKELVQEVEIEKEPTKEEKVIKEEETTPVEETPKEEEVPKTSPPEEEKEDNIEFLYSLDSEYKEEYYPRILIIKDRQYSKILSNINQAPLKVTGPVKEIDYVPDKAPVDLEHTLSKEEEEVKEEVITLYQKNNNDKVEKYADIETLKKFGIFPNNNYVMVDDTPYYEIREEDIKRLSDYTDRETNHASIEYISLPEEKKEEEKVVEETKVEEEVPKTTPKEEPVEEEAQSITYNPKNINATDRFLLSLKGEESFNVIHSLHGRKQVTQELLDYLNGDLEVKQNKEYIESLERLTDEQLLKEVYDNEETDTITKLNEETLNRLKNYILSQLNKCELLLQVEYDNLFYNIGQAKMLEANLISSDYEDEKVSYIQERRLKLKKAASSIQNIISIRDNADALLGKGILINIERVHEEFPYIGMRYNKDIPKELENYMEESQIGLEKALKEEDTEGIITNYLNLDSCYYEDMGSGSRIENSRSIGTKYYEILLNQFRYRDDSLAKKLLEEKALSSAEVHVASAEYIYDVKENRLVRKDALPISNEPWDKDTSIISEDTQKLDDIIIEYLIRNSEKEEVIEKLIDLGNRANSKLVDTINEIVEYLKKKKEEYPELDVNGLEEKLEVIIVHPEIISTKRIEKSEAMITYLSNIPKEALIYLILSASTCQMINDINEEVEKLNINENVMK